MPSSFPALLHFAHKYADSPADALLASANAGGENVHRGCVLGALLGAAHGAAPGGALPAWMRDGLVARDSIRDEADAFGAALSGSSADGSAGARSDL